MYTAASRKVRDNRVHYAVAGRGQTSWVGQSCALCCGRPRADIKGGTIVCTVLWQAAGRHQGWDNRVHCAVAGRWQTSRVGQSCAHRGKPRADIKGGTIVCTVLWQAAGRHQGWDNCVYTAASRKV